jgi:hypothetical protein
MDKIITISNYIDERQILIKKYFPEIPVLKGKKITNIKPHATNIEPHAFMVKILYELDKRLEALEKK